MIDAMQSSLFEDEILGSGGDPSAPEVDQNAQLRQQLEEQQATLRAETEAARQDAWSARQERDRADQLRAQAEWSARQEANLRAQAQQQAYAQQQWLAAQQAQAQALRPLADLTSADLDAAMSDPRKLQEVVESRNALVWQAAQQEMGRRDQWHEQRLAQVGQYFENKINQLGGQFGAALQPVNAMNEERAAASAEDILAGMGVPAEDFRTELPKVREILRGSAPGQAGNPQAVGLAYFLHKMNQPPQRERPTPPMSLSGDPSPTPRRRPGAGNFDRDEIAHIAKIKDALGPAAAKAIVEARRKGEV